MVVVQIMVSWLKFRKKQKNPSEFPRSRLACNSQNTQTAHESVQAIYCIGSLIQFYTWNTFSLERSNHMSEFDVALFRIRSHDKNLLLGGWLRANVTPSICWGSEGGGKLHGSRNPATRLLSLLLLLSPIPSSLLHYVALVRQILKCSFCINPSKQNADYTSLLL